MFYILAKNALVIFGCFNCAYFLVIAKTDGLIDSIVYLFWLLTDFWKQFPFLYF